MRVFPSMLSPSPHKKQLSTLLLWLLFLFISLSKLLLILSLLRLKLTTGGKRTLAPYPRRSHLTRIFFLHISSLPTYSNHSFAIPPPFFFCFPTVELVTICFLYCQMLDDSYKETTHTRPSVV